MYIVWSIYYEEVLVRICMKLLSWNTAKNLKKVSQQYDLIEQINPDIVALQEILPSTELEFKKHLRNKYSYITSSFELAKDLTILKNKRMFGQLIASKYPFTPLDPKNFQIPWPERVLSVSAEVGNRKLQIHTTHIPPGSSNGWIKIDMIKGIVDYFSDKSDYDQILCGDFNTPQKVDEKNGIITFGQTIKASGEVVTKKQFRGGLGVDWDEGERSLFKELREYGLIDVFRELNPSNYEAYSWQFVRKHRTFNKRFDHIFADKRLNFISCEYAETSRDLSDHLPIVAEFAF